MTFEEAMAAYVAAIEEKIGAYWAANGYDPACKPGISVEYGKRYARVVETEGAVSRSVHSFVDISTGDILKAASYKAPAKGARGSIYNLSAGGFSNFGADYRR